MRAYFRTYARGRVPSGNVGAEGDFPDGAEGFMLPQELKALTIPQLKALYKQIGMTASQSKKMDLIKKLVAKKIAVVSAEDLEKRYTGEELKVALELMGLPITGKKSIMLSRMVEWATAENKRLSNPTGKKMSPEFERVHLPEVVSRPAVFNKPNKALVIAEKPSVAKDIAQSLGGFKEVKICPGFVLHESEDYVVVSAIGHLLRIEESDETLYMKPKWSFKNLPVVPKEFVIKPIDQRSYERTCLIQAVGEREDISRVINACDAGREGELIFRHLQSFGVARGKPVERLWMQSMTKDAIQKAFHELRSDASMRPLYDAAQSRAEADWIIGINGTRAITTIASMRGPFNVTSVGRVQTPTLAMIVERDEEIASFIPTPFWTIEGLFSFEAGEFVARWEANAITAPPTTGEKSKLGTPDPLAKFRNKNRLWSENDVLKVISESQEYLVGPVEETEKPGTSAPPGLFDLTSLQRECSQKFGMSAKNTLSAAQSLYEKHKALTYPRTGSKVLPNNYVETVQEIMEKLASLPAGSSTTEDVECYANTSRGVVDSDRVRLNAGNEKLFNDAGVSDHFAIIPTAQGIRPEVLTDIAKDPYVWRVYDVVISRFIAAFMPPSNFLTTKRTVSLGHHSFVCSGKVTTFKGWKEVYESRLGLVDEDNDLVVKGSLVPLAEGETSVTVLNIQGKEDNTRPPPRLTDASLLSMMQGAGKLVDDLELRDALGDRGIGTPATRASIIEELITSRRYVERQRNELWSTAKGRSVIQLLKTLNIQDLQSPELTGTWEHQLALMEKGEVTRPEFMAAVARMAGKIVTQSREQATKGGLMGLVWEKLDPPRGCPKCKENFLFRTLQHYECGDDNCGFHMKSTYAKREILRHELDELFDQHRLGPVDDFKSRFGVAFTASLIFDPRSFKVTLEFQDALAVKELREATKLGADPKSVYESLGKCPKCAGTAQVLDLHMSYVCENALRETMPCDFKLPTVLLNRPFVAQEVSQLLGKGKTELLEGFTSNKKRRMKFSAHLQLSPTDSSLKFVFPPKKEKLDKEEDRKGDKLKKEARTRVTKKKVSVAKE